MNDLKSKGSTLPKKDADLPDFALMERQTMMRGLGLGREGIKRIQVGVVNSWGELNPASTHLKGVVESVKAGVWAAGGTPREFAISSICTSMAGADNFHLPHRDIVAAYIEMAAKTNLLDAMVFVPVCDDVIPAHLMAAARLDLPSIVVTGGYMRLNTHKGKPLDPLDVAPVHYQAMKEGRSTPGQFAYIQDCGCPGTGACPVMGTANTMAALTEALGMSLPYNATVPGADSRLNRIGFQAGEQAVSLHAQGLKPSRILTREAFENAIRALMALGGSTNAVLHLQAIAAELGMRLDTELFNELSRETPFICDVLPSGPGGHFLDDFDATGGMPALLGQIQPLLHDEVMTVTGRSLREDLAQARPAWGSVIRPLSDPLAPEGGLIFLKGSLAPRGALVKRSAVPEKMQAFKGRARVFSSEDLASQALLAGELNAGDVVVVRYMGPKGDPGMRLLQRFLWLLAGKKMQDSIAFITDGRFSGTNKGCAIGHVSPEAADGGPIAVIKDGDLIEVDIPNQEINLLIPPEVLRARLDKWQKPRTKVKGFLSVYSRMAKPTDQGAALDYDGNKSAY